MFCLFSCSSQQEVSILRRKLGTLRLCLALLRAFFFPQRYPSPGAFLSAGAFFSPFPVWKGGLFLSFQSQVFDLSTHCWGLPALTSIISEIFIAVRCCTVFGPHLRWNFPHIPPLDRPSDAFHFCDHLFPLCPFFPSPRWHVCSLKCVKGCSVFFPQRFPVPIFNKLKRGFLEFASIVFSGFLLFCFSCRLLI